MAPRLLVEPGLAVGARVTLAPDVAHHVVRVLRLREGDTLVLFDGRGGEYPSTLVQALPQAVARIERFDAVERESPLHVTLVQALIGAERLDWVVEKATELGVARLRIVASERGVVRLDGARLRRREARWREIVASACCQSGRTRIPEVDATTLDEVLRAADPGSTRLVLAPGAVESLASMPIATVPPTRLVLLVGPEGGWSPAELAAARAAGLKAVTLGPRTLRTETAGIAALAALQALAGDFAATGFAAGAANALTSTPTQP
ncbi:MAG TPA: 16S rRNA (uracil(1498)-N(3))-methyltransferase [Burkholderiaceae bacterium]|nr:16S rRNA (uracil(1498)-N(3))-methyltransferase [Burkholderiaceae bacterium]